MSECDNYSNNIFEGNPYKITIGGTQYPSKILVSLCYGMVGLLRYPEQEVTYIPMKILDKIQTAIPAASYFDKDEIDLMIKLLEIYRDISKHDTEGILLEKNLNTIKKLLDGFYTLRNEQHKIERAKAGLL